MKRMRLAWFLFPALLLLAAAAWAAKAPPAKPTPAPAATAPAPAAADSQAVADLVRMADDVAKEVEALRGWKFKEPVKKTVGSPQEVRAALEKEIGKQYPPGKVEQIQAFLRLVGLLPRDCDLRKTYLDLMQEQVGGFYDSETKVLCMVERGGKRTPAIDRVMLAHELTHALDDQHVDIEKTLRPLGAKTEDMDLVVASVIEGSATALMTQYMAQAQRSGRFDMDELQQYANEEAAQSRLLLGAPRYFTSMIGAYLCGMQFLGRGNLVAVVLADDNQAVGRNFLAAVKDPPRSCEQVLHPEKYWNADTRDEPVTVSDDAMVKCLAAPGRWVVHTDTLGEMLVAMVTTPKGSSPNLLGMQTAGAWTNAAASGWGGDRFYLLASGPSAAEAAKTLKDLRGVWVTLWDTPADRDEFLAAYESSPTDTPRVILRLGNCGAVALYGFSDADRLSLEKRLRESPPPMLKGGKPWAPWAL